MKLFDYFTGRLLCETTIEHDNPLKLYDEIKIVEESCGDMTVMIFAISEERQEILVAPPDGGNLPIKISFPRNSFECQKCGIKFGIGVTEEKPFEWQDKEWDLGLDLTRTIKIIKIVGETHKELCDLIRPVELIT